MANPYWRFGLLSLGGALVLALVLSLLINPILAWLVSANIATLILFRYDKSVAGSRRTRVPEAILLLLEAAGGTAGAAIAMWVIRPRHKTQSSGFLAGYLLILFLQFGVILALYWIV
ncbi:MAG TPA: DUF1294 domain-containing protein [Anaerolineae bacterium]